MEVEVFLLNVHVEAGFVEVFRQTESNFFLYCLVSNIVGPVVDLNKTAIAEVNKVDF